MNTDAKPLALPEPKINWDNIGKLILMVLDFLKLVFGFIPVPPVARTLWVLVLRETLETTPAQAAILTSADLMDAIERRRHHWRCCDPDGVAEDGKVPPGIQPYLDLAVGKSLPRLYVIAADHGDLFYAAELPSTQQAVIDLVTMYGG
jgi:hypothetical protein